MLRYLSKNYPRGKRVLVRIDVNVPIRGGRVEDDFRIRAVLPTIRRLLGHANRVVLLSHHSDRHQTLAPAAAVFGRLLGERVAFIKDLRRVDNTRRERVLLVENLRFWRGEETASPRFAKTLCQWGDVFVNDAFGVSHRRSASLTVLPRLLPSYLGLSFAAELAMLARAMDGAKHPFLIIIGGAKIATKLGLLRRLDRIADGIIVGGSVANTLLRANGIAVGRSPSAPATAAIRRLARSRKLFLPVDAVVKGRGVRTVPMHKVGAHERIFDIGPKTVALVRRSIHSSRTIVWNGPLGLTEDKRFALGTLAVARMLARSRGFVLVGGGDTVAFLDRVGLRKRFRHISTGGGAMLSYLAGEKLPGLLALRASKGGRSVF